MNKNIDDQKSKVIFLDFRVEYKKEYSVNTSTEMVFKIMNTLTKEDKHLEEGQQRFYKFYNFLLDIMTAKRAENSIRESISKYLSVRKELNGMEQYNIDFYMKKIEEVETEIQIGKFKIKVKEYDGVFTADVYNKEISVYCIKQGINTSRDLAIDEAINYIEEVMK